MSAAADGQGAWLELSVEADVEAVEAISEILGRAAPGGVVVEPAFELVEEGLGARIDPTRPATVRAYLPARDPAAAEAEAASIADALGHLQAFGLRPIGELRTRIVHEADWAERLEGVLPGAAGRPAAGHPPDVAAPQGRRPTSWSWRSTRAWRSGPGLHPTTRLCLAMLEAVADRGEPSTGARVLDVGCGSGILAIAAIRLGAARAVGVDIDPIAIEATAANAKRNGIARRIRARGRAACRAATRLRRRGRQPDRRRPRAAGRRRSTTSCDRAASSSRRGSSSTARPRCARPSRRPGSSSTAASTKGDWVALEAHRPA